MSNESQYAATWQQFVSQECTGSMFSGYHVSASGPVPLYNLGIRIIDQNIIARIQEVQSALIGLPDIEIHPAGWLHVTVTRIGGGPGLGEEPIIHPHDVPALVDRLAAALADVPPFTLQLRNVNAFPSVMFIEAHEDGSIADIRRRLIAAIPELPTDEFEFLPHLSICAFDAPTLTAAIIERIQRFRDFPVGTMLVDCLKLSSIPLDVATRNIFVPETYLAEFNLAG